MFDLAKICLNLKTRLLKKSTFKKFNLNLSISRKNSQTSISSNLSLINETRIKTSKDIEIFEENFTESNEESIEGKLINVFI